MYNLNPAIGKVYEPGSTFKIVTISAGLQTHAFTPATQVDDEGVIARYDTTLGNFDQNGHGMITPGDVLKFSSNVGAVKVAQALGTDRVRATLDKFGLTRKTGVNLAFDASCSAIATTARFRK